MALCPSSSSRDWCSPIQLSISVTHKVSCNMHHLHMHSPCSSCQHPSYSFHRFLSSLVHGTVLQQRIRGTPRSANDTSTKICRLPTLSTGPTHICMPTLSSDIRNASSSSSNNSIMCPFSSKVSNRLAYSNPVASITLNHKRTYLRNPSDQTLFE